MTDTRWTTLPTSPPGPGQSVALTANLADALIAYLAGPQHVQRVPRQHEDVQVRIGEGPSFMRAATADDRAEIQESIAEFLHTLGIPPPPADDEWRLFLPAGVAESDLRAAMNDPSIPGFTDSNGEEVVAEISRRLALLLGSME